LDRWCFAQGFEHDAVTLGERHLLSHFVCRRLGIDVEQQADAREPDQCVAIDA